MIAVFALLLAYLLAVAAHSADGRQGLLREAELPPARQFLENCGRLGAHPDHSAHVIVEAGWRRPKRERATPASVPLFFVFVVFVFLLTS